MSRPEPGAAGTASAAAAPPATWLDRGAAISPLLLVGAALLLFLGLALFPLLGDSSTFDEGTHLVAGYAVLTRGDYRLSTDNPPLGRVLAALPLTLMTVRWPADMSRWTSPSPWDFAFQFLYQSGNDPDRLLVFARASALLWGMALIVAVYVCSRRLFGSRGAMIALVLATFNPTLLAHGHLCTTDVAGTTLIFLTTWHFCGFLTAPSAVKAVGSGLLLGCAVATKFNALCLPPILALLAAHRVWKRSRDPGFKPDWIGGAGFVVGIAISSYLVIWAVYSFRFSASPDPSFSFDWPSVSDPGNLIDRGADVARARRLLPEAFLHGFKLMQKNTSRGHPTYALGLHAVQGWWWYFPVTFLVKTPAAALVLMGAGIVAAIRRLRQGGAGEGFAIVGILVYGGLAIGKNMTIGVRHLLPVYPFLIVLAAGALMQASGAAPPRWSRNGALSLLAFCGIETLAQAPSFLAHVSAPVRLFVEPYQLTADSNLDWGQDLGRLKRYVDRKGIARIKLAYFGGASPRHLGLKHERLPSFALYEHHEPEWPIAEDPRPGDVVAVSCSTYVGMFQGDPRRYQALLRGQRPIATIGDSILVFRIRAEPSR